MTTEAIYSSSTASVSRNNALMQQLQSVRAKL